MMLDPHMAALEKADLIQLAQRTPEIEYMFRHGLIHDAAYGSLLKHNRRALHRIIGETVERLYPSQLDELAPVLGLHFAEADQPDKAMAYFLRAGDAAAAKYANAEAVVQYDRALEMAARTGAARGELWRKRGHIRELTGAHAAARADFESALGESRAASDRRSEWQALMDLGFLAAAEDYMQAGVCFRAAADLARAFDDPRMLAESLNRLGNWYANTEQPGVALGLHREAMSLYAALNDDAGLAETYDLLGITGVLSGDLALERDFHDRALALFRALNRQRNVASDLAPRALAVFNGFNDCLVLPDTDLDTALRGANEARDLSRAIGWSAGEAFALIVAGTLLDARGEYGAALDALQSGLDTARRIGHRQWLAMAGASRSMLWFDLFQPARGQSAAESAMQEARAMGSTLMERNVLGLLARGIVRHGTPAQRGDMERRLAVALGESLDPPPLLTLSQRLCWAARGDLMLARGDSSAALALIEGLNASLPNRGTWGTREAPRMMYMLGLCRLALGALDEAESDLSLALGIAQAQGARTAQVEILHGLARVSAQRGDNTRETQRLEQARALVHTLAATVPDAAIRQSYLMRALAELDA